MSYALDPFEGPPYGSSIEDLIADRAVVAMGVDTLGESEVLDLEARRGYIGGSEVAAVLGMSRYSSAHEVWLEKTGRKLPFRGNEFTTWGNRLQRAIAQGYMEDWGRTLVPSALYRHQEMPYLAVNPDYEVCGEPGLVEIKNMSSYAARALGNADTDIYGDAASDALPEDKLCQCHWQMAIVNCHKPIEWVDEYVLVGGNKARTYRVQYDQVLGAAMIERVAEWWHAHVEADVAPELAACDADEAYLRTAHARDDGAIVYAAADIEQAAIELKDVRTAQAALEGQRRALEIRIKQFMGDAAELKLTAFDKPITWRCNKDSSRTDWQGIAAALKASATLIAEHTTVVPGARVFRVPFKIEKETGFGNDR